MKRRALVSVSNKKGVAGFARKLGEMGFEVISTGGTARALSEAGISVVGVSEVTGAPEILKGRVKTLHPRIHGGILADLEDPDQVVELVEAEIGPIDLVCVNLYPFEETIAAGAAEKEVVEQIDIGGPAMLRAAAKNFRSVAVVPDPRFYDEVLSEYEVDGEVSIETRRRLALEAFRKTAAYDAAIARWLAGSEETTPGGDDAGDSFPQALTRRYEKALPLRYGENPHQGGAYYVEEGAEDLLSGVERLQGKELSFNNLGDVDAARILLADLAQGGRPAAAIIKHANPCGAAVAGDLATAFRLAYESDEKSAFGGIVALNRPIDEATASLMVAAAQADVVIAPSYAPGTVDALVAKRKNTRLLQAPRPGPDHLHVRQISGGFLVQEPYRFAADRAAWRVVTRVAPTDEQWADAELAWRLAAYTKSNAVVLVAGGQAVGIGAGQQSRVDAGEIAARKAAGRGKGGACATDAFYPFRDGLDVAVAAGAAAVIQPGGSVNDQKLIDAADEAGIAMVLTGERQFRH